MNSLKHLCAFAVLGAAFCGPAAAIEIRGQTASGAQYLFEVPPNWTRGDGVVIYNHGFDSNPPDAPSIPEALKNHLAGRNFAIVASGYSQRGWALFATARDHAEAMAKFRADFGDPGRVYLTGGSLGGLVAMQQAEQGGLGFVSGVYALCAPLGGSRVWDQALDIRLSYDALCDGVSGGDLPRSSEQPFLLPESAVDNNNDSTTTLAEVALASGRCLGLGIDPALQSSGMRERRARLVAATSVPEAFLPVNLYYATFGLSDLYFDPGKLDRGLAFENRGVDYGDAALNASIRRVGADPLARLRLRTNYTPSGRLSNAGARVLTTTTSGDGLIFPEHQSALFGKLDEFNWARAQVRENPGSHCDYGDAETFAGFDAMVDWSRGLAPKPDATQLNQRCEILRAQGNGGQCRYENLPAPASLDTRIRPRSSAFEPVLDARWSGLWYDPARPGEGYVLELLADGRALLAWYTYPPPNSTGDQRWIFAEGRIDGNGLVFDNAIQTIGGKFLLQYDPSVISIIPFGPVRFAFDRCGHGFMEYQGPSGYGRGRHEIEQLSHLGNHGCNVPASAPPPVAQTRFSGAWGGRPQEGLFVSVQGDGRAFVTWYTYDLVLSQTWLFGEGRFVGNKLVVEDMLLPRGGAFGSDFVASSVRFERWGRAEFDFTGCNNLAVNYNALAGGYGLGILQFTRITQPLGTSCSQ